MKRCFLAVRCALIMALAIICLLAACTEAPIKLVQQNAASGGARGSTSLSSNCTPGNIVILIWEATSSGTSAAARGVSNLGNAVWTKVVAAAGGSKSETEIWVTTCGSTPGTTSTVSLSGTITGYLYNISEWSGLTAIQDSDSPQSNTTSYIPPSITTTNANDLLIAITGTSAGTPTVPGSPWVALSTASAFAPGIYQIVSSTGTYSADYTGGSGSNQSSAFAAFMGP